MYFRTWQRLSSVVLGLVFAPAAMADWGLNMPVGITEVSQSIFELHMLIFLDLRLDRCSGFWCNVLLHF